MKYIIKLATALLSILQKIEKARHIILMMTGNANFPSPVPSMTVLATAANQLEALSLKAKEGTKSDRAALRAKASDVDLLFKQLASHVEGVANANPATAEAVILSSGFDLRKKGPRTVTLFGGKATGKPGEILLQHQGVKRSVYVIEMCTDLSKANWGTIYEGTRGRFLATDLQPGAWYYFRARTISPNGASEWSDAVAVYLIK